MAIRVKLRLKSRLGLRREMDVIALVNSGFEADSPQVLVPVGIAKELDLYTHLLEARIESYGTVAGPVRLYVLPSSVEAWIEESDVRTPRIVCDVLISDLEREVLISDYLAGELGIIAEDFRIGLWRLKNDPKGKVRKSYKPSTR
mgnify:CR=1 FL=1